MYEEFTGFDVSGARNNISKFYEEMDRICWKMEGDLTTYCSELHSTWCSPKAVEFNSQLDKMWAANQMVYNTCYAIVENAVRAYNVIAQSNGMEGWYPNFPKETVNSAVNDPYYLVESKNGVVGMNVMQVKLSTDAFKKAVEDYKNSLDNLPTEIALYDPDNLQKGTYKIELTKAKETFTDTIQKVLDGIMGAIDTESQTILLAKEKSVDSLQNMRA